MWGHWTIPHLIGQHGIVSTGRKGLLRKHGVIHPGMFNELGMTAIFRHSALDQHSDGVGVHDRAQAVGDDDRE